MTSSRLALAGGPVLAEGLKPRLWPILSEEAKLAVRRVLDRGILSGASSPESRAFEEEFAEYVGARYCLLTHCGTSALELALVGAGVQAGDEVIVPAYSFVATAVAVLRVGAVPMFADVLPGSGNIDPKCVEAQITPRTKAIMPVHVHGCPSDLAELAAIAEKHQLVIVEDAAQAHGATYQGKAVGALFAGGGFSLQGSKNLSAGEGVLPIELHADRLDHAHLPAHGLHPATIGRYVDR